MKKLHVSWQQRNPSRKAQGKFNIKPNSINPPVGMEVPNKQENAGESFTKKMAKLNFDNKLINEHK